MRVYADTSFLVQLLVDDAGSDAAVAEYRRLQYPRLMFLPIHRLEVANALRQRALHARRAVAKRDRAAIGRERDTALSRVERWIVRGWLSEADADWEEVFQRASDLSARHTEKLGCRAFDVLHVAAALVLGCETFLTSDAVQGKLAKAEGLDVRMRAHTQ